MGRSNIGDAVEGDLDSDSRLLKGLRCRLGLQAAMDLYPATTDRDDIKESALLINSALYSISSKSTNDSRRQTFLVRPHRDFDSDTAFR